MPHRSESADLGLDREIAGRLRNTWPAFFQRFGRLRPVQRLVIPPLLAGDHLLVSSATASGKTEAVCAPLIERHIESLESWTILYVSPTRALINDLHARLEPPLRELGLRIARRTGEYKDPLNPRPHLLITTPESLDSLLCRGGTRDGHPLSTVAATVLDEIHLLHGGARGEQLRSLLHRLRRLRRYAAEVGWETNSTVQTVALSATVPHPDEIVDAYLRSGRQVNVPGGRSIEVVDPADDAVGSAEGIVRHVEGSTDDRKIIVFCNSRRRVDDLALELQRAVGQASHGVHAHHGSLSRDERERAERALGREGAVIVVSTSTLEIGIDIGDVDLVVLDDPPPDIPSLLQRIGRGNRRSAKTRVMPIARSLTDNIVHTAMLEAAREGWLGALESGPQSIVVRQQIASYVFQSPRRSRSRRRLNDFLAETFPESNWESILRQMIADGELVDERGDSVRLGDAWLETTGTGSLHSNIEDAGGEQVVDYATGRLIAGGIRFTGGRSIGVGGRSRPVKGRAPWKLYVGNAAKGAIAQGDWKYASRPWMKGAGQPQAVRRFLGVGEAEWPFIRLDPATVRLFHFGGARRKAVLELMEHRDLVRVTEWFADVADASTTEPHLSDLPGPGVLALRLDSKLEALERVLGRPRANSKLPRTVRVHEVREWLALDAEVEAIRQAAWIEAEDEALRDVLTLLGRAVQGGD